MSVTNKKEFHLPHGSIPVAGIQDKLIKEVLMKMNENLRAIEKELQRKDK